MPMTWAYSRCLWHGGLCRVTTWYSLGWKHCEWTIRLRGTSSHWYRFGLPFPPQNTTWSNLLDRESLRVSFFGTTSIWRTQLAGSHRELWGIAGISHDQEKETWMRQTSLAPRVPIQPLSAPEAWLYFTSCGAVSSRDLGTLSPVPLPDRIIRPYTNFPRAPLTAGPRTTHWKPNWTSWSPLPMSQM